MTSELPLVSVVIPVYNREETIIRCIDSALGQTYDNLEVIVVDDASTDSTVEVMQDTYDDAMTLLCHEENRGGSAARNTGIEQSSGKYIAFLDSDDVWKTGKIEHEVKVMEKRSDEWIGIYSNTEYVSQHPLTTLLKNLFAKDKYINEGCSIEGILSLADTLGGTSTLLVRKETVESISGFDPSFERHQDYEFIIRCLEIGKLAYLDENYVVKHETDYPSAESVERSKKKLFDKFATHIKQIESENVNVTQRHQFDLGRCHLRNGDLGKAVYLLRKSKPKNIVDMLLIGKAAVDRLSR